MTRSCDHLVPSAGADVLAKKADERRAKNHAAVAAYRRRLKSDPELWHIQKQKDKERAQKNRRKAKSEEEKQREKILHKQRQVRYLTKKKAEAEKCTPPARETRQDKAKADARREYIRLAVQKHRANQHPNKKRRVKEKRREYYCRKKTEKEDLLRKKKANAAQVEDTFVATGCPYPTKSAYLRAVRRLKEKVRVKGNKFAFLFKGILKTADKETKDSCKQLNINYTTPTKKAGTALQASPSTVLREHIHDINRKRDKATLQHKRVLAKVFQNMPNTGLSSRFFKSSAKQKTLYCSGSKVQKDIEEFFDNHASEIPCKKVNAKKQLFKPVRELFKEFRPKEKPVSLRTFHRMKPKHIQSVSKIKFRQCLCEICYNPKQKISRLDLLLKDKCGSVSALLDESVCMYDSAFPKLECINRQCENCGVERVCSRLENELAERLNEEIKWTKWELVCVGKSKRMEKVTKQGSVHECVKELMKELEPLYRHTFTAQWQRLQVQCLKRDLPDDWALVTMDFAENFLCKFQDEPQSAHWGYTQVTVFPVVIHTRCSCGELRRDSLIFFSDDLRHDSHATQAFVDKTLMHVSSIKNIKKVVLLSDGCAAQFKSKLPFHFLTRTQFPNNKSVAVEKIYFGARHGKNDCDWLGGAIKRNVTRDISARLVTIKGAVDMFEHCSRTMSQSEGPGECLHKLQTFFHIKKEDIHRNNIHSGMIKTVPGSRKLHHLQVRAENVLATREFSCFCQHCLKGDYTQCGSASYVGEWQTVRIKFLCSPPVAETAEDDKPVASGSDDSSDTSVVYPVSDDFDPYPERLAFFHRISDALGSCMSFDEVKQASVGFLESVQKYPIPTTFPSLAGHAIDQAARNLLDPAVQQHCIPLRVQGDGNCLFRSLSLVLFGNEGYHQEMRCRIAMAMALDSDLFLDGSKWWSAFDQVSPDSIVEIAALTSVTPDLSPRLALEREVMSCIQNNTFSGLWELQAAAHVLRCPLLSVFPSLGWELYRVHCNRIFRSPNCNNAHKVIIMWSSTRADTVAEHWTPNHFVPVALVRPDQQIPKTGSFHIVEWHHKDYLAEVKETDELLQMACVLFYQQKPGTQLFSAPARPDFSWEPFKCFRKQVQLRFVAKASSRRCQYVTICE